MDDNNPLVCLRCQTPLTDLGEQRLRVGGAAGVGGMLLGGWNQLAEGLLTVHLYSCPACGHLEFFRGDR
jgi:hypothetical protein